MYRCLADLNPINAEWVLRKNPRNIVKILSSDPDIEYFTRAIPDSEYLSHVFSGPYVLVYSKEKRICILYEDVSHARIRELVIENTPESLKKAVEILEFLEKNNER